MLVINSLTVLSTMCHKTTDLYGYKYRKQYVCGQVTSHRFIEITSSLNPSVCSLTGYRVRSIRRKRAFYSPQLVFMKSRTAAWRLRNCGIIDELE